MTEDFEKHRAFFESDREKEREKKRARRVDWSGFPGHLFSEGNIIAVEGGHDHDAFVINLSKQLGCLLCEAFVGFLRPPAAIWDHVVPRWKTTTIVDVPPGRTALDVCGPDIDFDPERVTRLIPLSPTQAIAPELRGEDGAPVIIDFEYDPNKAEKPIRYNGLLIVKTGPSRFLPEAIPAPVINAGRPKGTYGAKRRALSANNAAKEAAYLERILADVEPAPAIDIAIVRLDGRLVEGPARSGMLVL